MSKLRIVSGAEAVKTVAVLLIDAGLLMIQPYPRTFSTRDTEFATQTLMQP